VNSKATPPNGTSPPRAVFPPGLVMGLIIVFWGLGPPVSKLITAPPVISVLYRFWLSVPILFAIAWVTGNRPSRSTLIATAPAGAAFGINLVFVFLTINTTAVAVLSVFTTLQPGIILLVAGPFLGERPGWWHVAWTIVGIGGTSLVVLGGGSEFDANLLGVVYALAAMIMFTAYFLLTKKARTGADQVSAIEWMTGISLFAAVAVTPWALLSSDKADYLMIGGKDWIWLAFVIAVTGIAGHVMMAWTHRYLDATRSSLYLLSMNIVAIGASWIIHDEPLNLIQLAGGIVVFGAVGAVVTRPGHKA